MDRAKQPPPRLRLFWFHHAGGSSANYRPWQALFPPEWQLVFADYPGRGTCAGLAPEHDLARVVHHLLERYALLLDMPYALFGHSMGSLVAASFTQVCAQRGLRQPFWLGVSGHRAPHRPARTPCPLHKLSDSILLKTVCTLGGTTPGMLPCGGERARFLKLLRADLAACENHRLIFEQPLTQPVTAYAAADDPLASLDDAAAWAALTRGPFKLHTFTGGHFYLSASRAAFVRRLVADIQESFT